ncbi:MAG: NADH-quinone oxidoreductase subunit NuoH [Gemmatimonadales bacterium]
MTPELKGDLLVTVVKLLVSFLFVLVVVAYTTLLERWICAWMQDRLGPNRTGPRGILQPVADGIKNILKEEMIPGSSNKFLFVLAPMLALFPAIALPMVIAWGAPLPVHFDFSPWLIGGLTGRFVFNGVTSTAVADLPVGFLFVLAFSSLGVYGIALAGWSSNNKYSLMGGLRAGAQMISYEIALGLSLVPILLLTGNVSLSEIVARQQQGAFGWFIFPLALSAFVFMVSSLAETNRVPFDLPEAESELVAGYHSEYSAMKFSAFFIAEYANMLTASMMFSTLFLGGWGIPFTTWDERGGLLQTLVTGTFFFARVGALIFLFIWLRWTLPRFRFDQLMALGWKVLLPISMAYLLLIAGAVWGVDAFLGGAGQSVRNLALFLVNLPVLFLVFRVLDRGTLVSGSYRRTLPAPGRQGPSAV